MAERAARRDSVATSAGGRRSLRPVPVRRIGEYDVLASLGRGGAGEVFLALRQGPHEFRKVVVLKLLHPYFEDDPEVVEMFLDEARLAGRLDHPSIVQTLEVGIDGDRHFMVMDYLAGIGLDTLLVALGQRRKRMPQPLAAWVTSEVLVALHYAHELRDHDGTPLEVVHRDVSPSNIFLCWDGTVRLIDFGIAKAKIRRATTDSGIIKGKWGWVAPEHARGIETDRRADLWSAGVVLWELLTGEPLFPNQNQVATLQALVSGAIPSVRDYAPDTPEALVRVVERALERDPDERYPTAAAMVKDLALYLAEHASPARREDLAELLGEALPGERERQRVLLGDLVGGALAVSRTGSFGVARPPTSTPVVLSGQTDGASRLPLALAAAAVAALTMIAVGGLLEHGRAPAALPQVEAARAIEPEGAREGTPGEPVAASPVEEVPPPPPPTPSPEPVEPTSPAPEAVDRAPRTGKLTLDTTPWSEVTVDGRELGTTPLLELELPAGEHELLLRNPELGLERTHRVVVRAGEHSRRRIPLE